MGFFVSLVLIYIIYSINGAIVEVKNASLRNKSIFIDEFKKLGYEEHEFTKSNYKNIKNKFESNYPQIEFVKSQDLKYASAIFRNSKNSEEYKNALKGKEDIAKIYREIEFDTLSECFTGIIKVEGINKDSKSINKEFADRNKKLFKAISSNIFFSKKIVKMIKLLFIVILILIIQICVSLFPIIKIKLM